MRRKTITTHAMFHDPDFSSTQSLDRKQEERVVWYNARVGHREIQIEEVPCLCGSDCFDIVTNFDRNRAAQRVVLCCDCGLMRCSPRLTPASYKWFYESDFFLEVYTPGLLETVSPERYVAEARKREPLRQRAIDGIDAGQIRSVAEVGCASGLNVYGFHLDGLDVWGCDPSPHMIGVGREMGLDLHQGSTEKLGDRRFDLIILSHVLEHMLDPILEMTRLKEALSEIGAIYVEVPDARVFCLGALQSAHTYYFTPRQLTSIASAIGLSPVSENLVDGGHFGMVFVPAPPPPQ